MTHPVATGSFLACLLLGACAPRVTPPQSPTNDVQPPTTTTSDGEVVGADRVAPGQKLEEGPTLDSHEGLKPAAHPAKE
jgi:hypothetical protein